MNYLNREIFFCQQHQKPSYLLFAGIYSIILLMLAKVFSGACVGLESVIVEVEVDISSRSLPSFTIVGLPGKAVEEAKERVRAAIKNSGFEFPRYKITINLSPADLPKEGPAYDLPIALAILLASGQIQDDLKDSLMLGELSLDGSLRHTNSVLPMALLAKKKKLSKLFLPAINAKEAAMVNGLEIYPVVSLRDLFHHLNKTKVIEPQKHLSFRELKQKEDFEFDMAEIVGQEQAKRVLEIIAAGGHNMLMIGPPGAGKTLLARTLPSILPELTEEEALETTKIYSITGNLPEGKALITNRPFRAPHHTVSRIGLIGGGSKLNPGEISLSHRGVLFLDEFPEFPRNVLEALRQPLEDGFVQISRAAGSVIFPSKFLLIAASNPCPCGYLGSSKKHCTCFAGQVARYRKRISGPIMDRIDVHIYIPEVEVEKLTNINKTKRENSREIQKRVQQAREKQLKRFKDLKSGLVCNSEMNTKQVKEICSLDVFCLQLMQQAAVKMSLSARAYFRVIKVARTIADLSDEEQIKTVHLAEALQYRLKDEQLDEFSF